MGWLSGYSYRKPLVLTGGASGAQTDFQLDIDIAHVAAKMQTDFDDIRFTQNNGTTLIDAWLESKVDGTSADMWAEFPTTPANTVEQTYYMYYGNAGAANYWDGAATFIQYHGSASANFIDSLIIPFASYVWEGRVRATSSTHNIQWGLGNVVNWTDDAAVVQSYSAGNQVWHQTISGGVTSSLPESPALTVNQWYKGKIIFDGTTCYGYFDDNEIGSGGITVNLPNENMGLLMYSFAGTQEQEWSFARKYAANPPTYAFGSEESAPTAGNPFWYYQMLRRRNQ